MNIMEGILAGVHVEASGDKGEGEVEKITLGVESFLTKGILLPYRKIKSFPQEW